MLKQELKIFRHSSNLHRMPAKNFSSLSRCCSELPIRYVASFPVSHTLTFHTASDEAGGVRGWKRGNNVLIVGLAFYSVHKG